MVQENCMFYQYLENNGISDITEVVEYDHPVFSERQESKVFSYLNDIVRNKKSVLIEGDYDVDGIMSALCVRDALEALGVTATMFKYQVRTHNLDRYAMHKVIREKFDYFIVLDTGSSDMDILKRVSKAGIKIIVFDHHDTIYEYSDYPDEVAIINSVLESKMGNGGFKLSAGALSFCVMYKFLDKFYGKRLKYLSAYALTSLYSDCIDMSDSLNREIYWMARSLATEELPKTLQHFLFQYDQFNRRYIEFCYAPRINALFRAEHLKLINYYFFNENDNAVKKATYIDTINGVYTTSRNDVLKISDLVTVEELDNFVICDLKPVESILRKPLYNYTGLIANKLTDRYNKTAVVYVETADCYKGSVRDKFGRNYLRIFRQLCYAGGHNAAFGIKIPLLELDKFFNMLKLIDLNYSQISREKQPIIEILDGRVPDMFLLHDMAVYNEFSGNELPVAYVQKNVDSSVRSCWTKYGMKYEWGDVKIRSTGVLDYGSTFTAKVLLRKSITLMV